MANLGIQNTEGPAVAEDWTKYYSLINVAVIILLVWIGVRDEITIIVAIVLGALGIAMKQSWPLVAMFLLFSILYLLIPRVLQSVFGGANSAADWAVGRLKMPLIRWELYTLLRRVEPEKLPTRSLNKRMLVSILFTHSRWQLPPM